MTRTAWWLNPCLSSSKLSAIFRLPPLPPTPRFQDLHGIPCQIKILLTGFTRDSRVKTNSDNVETVKDVNNTLGSPKENKNRCPELVKTIYTRFRVKNRLCKNLHGIPVLMKKYEYMKVLQGVL